MNFYLAVIVHWALLHYSQVKLPTNDDGNITLPSELCVTTTNNLIQFVFAELETKFADETWMTSRAILCPRNELVDRMNDCVLDMFPGSTY